MIAINRLYKYFEYKNITPAQFEEEHSFAKGFFSKAKNKGAGLTEKTMRRIIKICKDLNPVWFVTGNGRMTIELEEETSNNRLIQENLRLRKELDKANGAIEVMMNTKNMFGGDLEEIKQKYSELLAIVQELQDKAIPDN